MKILISILLMATSANAMNYEEVTKINNVLKQVVVKIDNKKYLSQMQIGLLDTLEKTQALYDKIHIALQTDLEGCRGPK